MLLGHLCQPAGQRPARSEREEDQWHYQRRVPPRFLSGSAPC